MLALLILAATPTSSIAIGCPTLELETIARDRAELHLGVALAAREIGQAAPFEDALRVCGSDVGCLSGRLNATGVGLGLWITAGDLGISALLLDGRHQRVLGTAHAEPSEPAPQAIARITDSLLEAAGYGLAARLVVELHPREAQLFLDGVATSAEQTRMPGPIHLRAEAAGYEPWTAELVLTKGERTELSPQLEPTASIFESPWFWGGTAVVAAGVVVTVAMLVRPLGSVCVVRGQDPCAH